MELGDIIKADGDRLFILDNECYILFSGETLEDEVPFIRIGNWVDLPVRSIPLIENIIITDSIVGDPAYEQFNIDINYLTSNRFVGSRQIVKAFLNYQQNFSLDLKDAMIIDIEKDVPDLTEEKIIFSRSAFMGIFHYNGNFRIVYNEEDLFNLEKAEKDSPTDFKVHELISKKNRETERYSGSGAVLIDGSFLFYKGKYFSSYLFPGKYYASFNRLNIDPAAVREIILPVNNLLNITRLIKWKNDRGGRLRFFSNFREGFELVKVLFPALTVIRQDFDNLSLETGDGLNITGYTGTLNIRLIYKNVKPSYEELRIAYLREYSGLEKILKDDIDAVFVPYTIYEQTALLFKSSAVPGIIIDDGNRNIIKLKGSDNIIIYNGLQYEFRKYTAPEDFIKDALKLITNIDIVSNLNGEDSEGLDRLLSYDFGPAENPSFGRAKDIFNAAAVLKFYLNTTKDRKFSALVRKAVHKLETLYDREVFFNTASDINRKGPAYRITLFFYNDFICEFIEEIVKRSVFLQGINRLEEENPQSSGPVDENQALFNMIKETDDEGEDLSDGEGTALSDTPAIIEEIGGEAGSVYLDIGFNCRNFLERIVRDRKRFMDLLALLNKGKKEEKEISRLDQSIQERKDLLFSDDIKIDNREIKRKKLQRKLRIAALLILIPIALILLYFASKEGYNLYVDYRENQRVERERLEQADQERLKAEQESLKKEEEKKEISDLIMTYNIHVSDRDIYEYANKVAGKNGYRSIEFKALKEKNPNWIYPGNIFYMLDGQKIVVKKGDTLWQHSYDKLMAQYIEFYRIIKKLKSGEIPGDKAGASIQQARKLAFSSKHLRDLDEVASAKKK